MCPFQLRAFYDSIVLQLSLSANFTWTFICTRQPQFVGAGEMTLTLQQINHSMFVHAFLDQVVIYLGWLMLGAMMCWVLSGTWQQCWGDIPLGNCCTVAFRWPKLQQTYSTSSVREYASFTSQWCQAEMGGKASGCVAEQSSLVGACTCEWLFLALVIWGFWAWHLQLPPTALWAASFQLCWSQTQQAKYKAAIFVVSFFERQLVPFLNKCSQCFLLWVHFRKLFKGGLKPKYPN